MNMLRIAAIFAATAFLGACSVDGHVNRCGIGAGANIGPGTETCVLPHRVAGRPAPGYPPPVAYGQPGPSYSTPAYGAPGAIAPVPSYYTGGQTPPQWVRTEHPPANDPNAYRCDMATGRPANPGNGYCGR